MLGVDIQQIPNKLEDSFINRCFTKSEILYAKDRIQTLIGLFCAKEAYIKASQFSGDLKEIEITHDTSGKPLLFVNGKPIKGDISISHSKDYAIAAVILLEV